ncbi:MAG: methyltransferase domain-containing protein, partial [Calditrichaeota bacterium]
MKKQYCVIELQIDLFDPDLLPAMLFREGCNGIEEKSGGVWHIFFKEAINSEKLKGIYDALHPLNSAFDPSMMRLSVRQEEDWLSEWKKNFVPLRIDGKIWITPPWEKPASKPGEIELIIDPRMAFGTGHHATTQLMIQMMHRYVKNGDRVLDAGCGSGILAILAEKLGARNVFGFDIETEAIENARHNSEINKCSKIR